MYGENTDAIRAELSTLLRQHRIQQRIGGRGTHAVPETTTVHERAEIGRLIQRYRHSVLTWCRHALTISGPALPSTQAAPAPDAQLRRRLLRTLDAVPSALPTLEELTTPHRFPLVEGWRHAARAASLGEHDLAGDLGQGRLDLNQRLTVIQDAAEIIRGLLVLDQRYHGIPEWETLRHSPSLQRAAEACAFLGAADYSVDRLGWRPPARTIGTPPPVGIGGVVQAEHNLLIHLNHFPTALNLRRVLDSQRELSHLLAVRSVGFAPDLADRWSSRAATYAALQREVRNLGGHLGSGGAAAAEGANATTRLRTVSPDSRLDERALRDLDALFSRVDARIASIVDQGAHERLYFVRTRVPRPLDGDDPMVPVVGDRFLPIESPARTALVEIVHHDLSPGPALPPTLRQAARTREEFRVALVPRPASGQELGL